LPNVKCGPFSFFEVGISLVSSRFGIFEADSERIRGNDGIMKRGRWILNLATALLYLFAASAARAAATHTNPLNLDPLVREAYVHFYNLDFPGAVDRFERFHAQHPGDPQATALLLNAEIFNELYSLDLLDTTFYANDGFLTGRHATQENPKARDRIFSLADEAVQEADWRVGRNSNDIDALFARGWARSLRCAYMAMVERAFGAGFRLATKAKDDEIRVLQLDPDYVDSKLVVGVYEYVVGALPWPFKFLVGFAGVTGSKSRGLEMLYDDANRGILTTVEARTVIALFLRREGRYQEAIQVVRTLKTQYPHDYLFRLEEANLLKDAGAGMGAVEAYRQILADAAKPNYFFQARLELTYFGLGDALRGQRHYGEAAQSYEQAAVEKNVGAELKIRSLLAAGEYRDLNSERQKALADYQAAIAVGPKTSRADTARKLLQSPYRGN
jgi:tetratricopeptide (TPR) repeat protein